MSTIDLHHHNFYEIYFFLDGDVRFRVEGKAYQMQPGDLLLISPQELHQAEIQTGTLYERVVLWIDCAYLDSLSGDGPALRSCFDRFCSNHFNLIRQDHYEQIYTLLDQMLTEYYTDQWGGMLNARGLLLQLMVLLNRISMQTSVPEAIREDSLTNRVIAYIHQNYARTLSLELLASEFYVSKYYLSHTFREHVGTSLYRYLTYYRLMQAKRQMQDGIHPTSACVTSGFQDYPNFYRAFKAEFGQTPKEYMQQLAKGRQ